LAKAKAKSKPRKKRDQTTEAGYESRKEAARKRNAALSKTGRDIAPLPEIIDKVRRERCRYDFRLFCETYFPETYYLKWSEDHLRVIKKIENAVLHGGLFAMAMPRGSGKTSLCETACLWALLYGHHAFVTLIGADAGHAREMLGSIKIELETNDQLLEDFPEVVYPIHRLDGISHKAHGQLHKGKRTHIGWTALEIILPSIPGSAASGALIRVAGITGRIRGMKYNRAGQPPIRPSLVIVDDPQTEESAWSDLQCETRERTLAGAVLGLAGPGQKISGVMPCTVIRRGDMADVMLDRQKNPDWQGERTKMIYEFPKNEKLWATYEELRADELRAERGLARVTEFYIQHRAAMDKGARVAWPERYNTDEASATQHAMNIKFRNEAAFFAEYQNEPLNVAEESVLVTADDIAKKVNSLPRGVVPVEATRLTAFIDIHKAVLYYAVAAWSDNFSGQLIDYGTYPKQPRTYFTLRDVTKTLQRSCPTAGLEGAIYAGLAELAANVLAREWRRDDGAQMRVERCLIDANWGQSTDVVYQFCRQSDQAAILLPSHGLYVGASGRPFSEYKRKRGDRVGLNWRMPNVRGRRSIRHVVYDTNFWKSFVALRFAVPMGDAGCLSLFGKKATPHRLYAEHMTAEFYTRTEGRGRTVDEWRLRPKAVDNHWLDCTVGCAVAAAMLGVALPGTETETRQVKKKIRLSDIQKGKA